MIFFVYPDPKGSEENQFTPLGAGVNKLIFKRFWILYVSLPIVILHYSIFQQFFQVQHMKSYNLKETEYSSVQPLQKLSGHRSTE